MEKFNRVVNNTLVRNLKKGFYIVEALFKGTVVSQPKDIVFEDVEIETSHENDLDDVATENLENDSNSDYFPHKEERLYKNSIQPTGIR